MEHVNTSNGAGQCEVEAEVVNAISGNALLAASDVVAIAKEVDKAIEPESFALVFRAAVAVFYRREFGDNLAIALSTDR